MSQSLSKIYIHLVFHIGNESPTIQNIDKEHLYAYIGAVVKDNGSQPLIINGTDNHIHLLFVLSKNSALANLVQQIKQHSSRWIKQKNDYYRHFAWQGGYGAFSVSSSGVEKTKRYISDQEKHHARRSFKDEYQLFLKEYDIEYNEQYL